MEIYSVRPVYVAMQVYNVMCDALCRANKSMPKRDFSYNGELVSRRESTEKGVHAYTSCESACVEIVVVAFHSGILCIVLGA